MNTIVFSALTGLEVNGAADYVTGVHVWFPVNHAVAFPDSYAFHITGAGNRFMGCCTPPRQPPPCPGRASSVVVDVRAIPHPPAMAFERDQKDPQRSSVSSGVPNSSP